jgi:hypothetical protein
LSIRVLLDNYIFENPNYIRKYEFNIGNRTIQLPKDFTTNFEFPNVVVSLNDETLAMGQRPEVSQSVAGWNVDQIPVLYDSQKENILYVQEEMVNVPITVTVNCESQLQAKEVANVAKRWLPFGKFIQFLEYTSFLEISDEFLNENLFNIDGYINNLYTKLDKHSGRVQKCFSITYKPFIRLDSISTAIPDSTQKSFQVVIDLTYMIQFPLYLYNDQLPQRSVERIDFAIAATGGFEPIADQPSSKIINHSSADDLTKGYIDRQYIVYDNNSRQCTTDVTTCTILVDQITAKSADNRILLNIGADDCLYITLDGTTKFKVVIANITETGITIPIDTDYYFLVTKDSHGNITVTMLCSWHCVKISFDPKDFEMSTDYSYNIVSGTTLRKNYQDYRVDLPTNSVELGFINSNWTIFEPSVVHPLIVQFYLASGTFSHQFGGTPPLIANLKAANLSTTAAVLTWTSAIRTTTCIEYGLTTEYGNFSQIKEALEYGHNVPIYGLSSNTLYHYRVNTTDENGALVVSDDATLTTKS